VRDSTNLNSCGCRQLGRAANIRWPTPSSRRQDRKARASEASEFDSPVGKGVLGIVDGKPIALAARGLMTEQKVNTSALDVQADTSARCRDDRDFRDSRWRLRSVGHRRSSGRKRPLRYRADGWRMAFGWS